MPTKVNTYWPIKNDINSIKNTFIAVQKDMRCRSLLESSWVRPTKIGTAPRGLITENNAPKISKNSSICG
jgi:hypothetical protein